MKNICYPLLEILGRLITKKATKSRAKNINFLLTFMLEGLTA